MQPSLIERFIDPTLITGLDTAEKLAGSFVTMVMGMGTTFVVLTVICAVTILSTGMIGRLDKKETGK